MTGTGTTNAAGTPCRQPSCAGALEPDGFCDTCGTAAPPPSAVPVQAGPRHSYGAVTAPVAGTAPAGTAAPGTAPAGPGTSPATPTTGPPATGSPWSGPIRTGPTGSRPLRGGHDADIPPVRRIDPRSALLVDPQIPENERFCHHGGTAHPVGRGRDGRPARLRGFCPLDRTPYSFAPPLKAGTLVAGQYQVEGALAHGGLGWIYLAADRNVGDRWVVLKGVLNADDPTQRAAALAEREFLAQLSHPGIVAIHNFVRHVDEDGVDSDYIVMAYVGGKTLAQVVRESSDGPAQRVVHALNYMIKTLPALGHLHAEGHVYSDLKPDNVMQTEQQLTLIDMGAVARIDDRDAVVFGTVGYHAPEVERGALSPASDVYTVGRTLAVLALDMDPIRGRAAAPLPAEHPMLQRHESLHRLLRRAPPPPPGGGCAAAAALAEQLAAVRGVVLAVAAGRPRATVSAVFAPAAGAFAAGLLLGRDGPGRPDRTAVAALLPGPLVDPADPIAPTLAAVAAGAPVPPGTAADWRLDWCRATSALAVGDLDAARAGFDALFSTFPGELVPRLALGAVAECAGRDDEARHHYAQVVAVDPGLADAAFGLARAHLRAGGRAAAVTALHAVPAGSGCYLAAQLASVEATVLAGGPGQVARVDEAELRAAAARVAALPLDDVTTLRMRVAVLDAAVGHLAGQPAAGPGEPLFGLPWQERAVRLDLERSLRALARLTPDAAERVALVDRANDAHPRTLR